MKAQTEKDSAFDQEIQSCRSRLHGPPLQETESTQARNPIPRRRHESELSPAGPLAGPPPRALGAHRRRDVACVLADPECAFDGPLYVMYRDCALTPEDRAWLGEQGVRFDLTVIPPATLGGEYVKTKGHYHPKNEAGIGYPELYQVLAGEAHYLLQKKDLSDVVAVTARAGDVVLVPPGYGHVTINPGEEVLVMANLVSTRFESEYGFYEEMCGAAYYEMESEGWVRNARYSGTPSFRKFSAGEVPEGWIRHGRGIYDWVTGMGNLQFLNAPEEIFFFSGKRIYSADHRSHIEIKRIAGSEYEHN